MNTHTAKIVTKARLHEGAHGEVKRSTRRAQYFLHDRQRSGVSSVLCVARLGTLGPQTLVPGFSSANCINSLGLQTLVPSLASVACLDILSLQALAPLP
jgi:hypothetical protein